MKEPKANRAHPMVKATMEAMIEHMELVKRTYEGQAEKTWFKESSFFAGFSYGMEMAVKALQTELKIYFGE